MQKQHDRLPIVSYSAVFALFFVLIEGIKAYRASQWSGTSAMDLSGVALGYLLYWAVLTAAASVIGIPLRKRLRFSSGVPVLSLVGCSLASLFVWCFLSYYREFAPTLDDAVVVAGIGGLGIFAGVFRFFFNFSAFRYLSISGSAFLSGWAALYASGYYWLFEDDRALHVTVVPLAVTAGALLVLMAGHLLLSRRHALAYSGLCVLVVVLPLALGFFATRAPARTDDSSQPNLILVVSDTLRAKSLALYGGPVASPHLNALADGGHVFNRAYALAPWTLPSMTGLFASDYPPSLTPGASGDTWTGQLWQYAVPPGRESLAEKLRTSGYVTGAFTANAFLPVLPGIMAGFDTHASAHPILLLPQGLFNHLPFLQDALLSWAPSVANYRPHNTTIDMTHYAEAFLRRHCDKPFFLWIHYIDPHAPYDPPAAYRRRTGAWPFFHPYSGGERWGIPVLGPDYSVPEQDRDYVTSLYEGEVAYMDEFLGRLRRSITANGLDGNTVLCFTSDHGEELWEHGDWGHGQSLYEELVHVPLLIAGPGVAPGQTSAPVSAIDLIPTLADLTGVPPEAQWRGRSLRPLLEDPAAAVSRPVFIQGTSNKAWPHPLQAVIDDEYKLIRALDTGALQLFNLQEDPAEARNLSEDEPERAAAMAAMLDGWMETFTAVFPVPDEAAANGGAELFDELRGMGYLR